MKQLVDQALLIGSRTAPTEQAISQTSAFALAFKVSSFITLCAGSKNFIANALAEPEQAAFHLLFGECHGGCVRFLHEITSPCVEELLLQLIQYLLF